MPQIAPITVKNGAATPTDVTYNPKQQIGVGATAYRNESEPLFDGQQRLQISVVPGKATQGSGKGEPARVKLTLNNPRVVVNVSGTSEVADEDTAIVTLTSNRNSNAARRKDLRVTLINLLGHADVIKMFDALEGGW